MPRAARDEERAISTITARDPAERGEVIGAHDLWIAVTALAHGLGVATRNASEFGRVPGLRVVVTST